MKRIIAAALTALALIGCSRGYIAEPIAAPRSQVDRAGKNFLSDATHADCFEVTAYDEAGFTRASISLGTFCRSEDAS